MKPNIIIALVVGGVVGFMTGKMVGGTAGSPNAPSVAAKVAGGGAPAAAGDVLKVSIDGAPMHGSADALVTLVEFSDYQCPFCSRAHATVKQLEQDYGAKLRVVMKQNPLSFHPNAKPAALAALAAGEQGKYWEMHDRLFANQQDLSPALYEKFAGEIGLDVAKWKGDLESPKLQQVIDRDQGEAGKLGANGTPAFFINGRLLSGAQPIDRFKAIIDDELGKAQAMVQSGVPASQVYAKIMEKAADAPPPPPPAAPQPSAPPAPAAVRKIDVPADAPAKGPKAALVTIVEWSDFQCPFCSRVVPTLKQIEDTYGKDVKVVFRNQPLPFHDHAKLAAEAAMAAHEQGKFWPMHDKLFANQGALERANLESYAQDLGLDMGKFKAALDSGKFKAAIEADSSAGNAAGANGTPTFFINGREFVGAQPFEAFKAVIDEELAKANKLVAAGTKREEVYAKLMAEAAKAPPPSAAPAEAAPAAVQNIEVGTAPVKGPKNAPVTIVEWSDFQCPFCGRVVPTISEIEKQYGNKVRLAFKHQPLPFHNNAKPAAMAAMAANEQGKFWQMHDKLFANQGALERANLDAYAKDIGLDMAKFKAAMDSNKFDAQITADSNEGMKVGANGTPTFFINGRQVVGAQPIEAFKAVIDEELKKKGK